jgi:hypothetical protein
LKRLEELYKKTCEIDWPFLRLEDQGYGMAILSQNTGGLCYEDPIYLNISKDEIKEMIGKTRMEKLTVQRNLYGARIEVSLTMNDLLKFDGVYGPRGELKRFVSTVEKEIERRKSRTARFVVAGKVGDFYKSLEYENWAPPFAG